MLCRCLSIFTYLKKKGQNDHCDFPQAVKMNTLQLSTPIRVKYFEQLPWSHISSVNTLKRHMGENWPGKRLLVICSFVSRVIYLTVVCFPLNHQDRTRCLLAGKKERFCVTRSTQEQIPKHWGYSKNRNSRVNGTWFQQHGKYAGQRAGKFPRTHIYTESLCQIKPAGELGGHFKFQLPT